MSQATSATRAVATGAEQLGRARPPHAASDCDVPTIRISWQQGSCRQYCAGARLPAAARNSLLNMALFSPYYRPQAQALYIAQELIYSINARCFLWEKAHCGHIRASVSGRGRWEAGQVPTGIGGMSLLKHTIRRSSAIRYRSPRSSARVLARADARCADSSRPSSRCPFPFCTPFALMYLTTLTA